MVRSLLCFFSSEPFINIKQGNEVAKLPNKKNSHLSRCLGWHSPEMTEWLITDLGSVICYLWFSSPQCNSKWLYNTQTLICMM